MHITQACVKKIEVVVEAPTAPPTSQEMAAEAEKALSQALKRDAGEEE